MLAIRLFRLSRGAEGCPRLGVSPGSWVALTKLEFVEPLEPKTAQQPEISAYRKTQLPTVKLYPFVFLLLPGHSKQSASH
jgi:hypothetical protein